MCSCLQEVSCFSQTIWKLYCVLQNCLLLKFSWSSHKSSFRMEWDKGVRQKKDSLGKFGYWHASCWVYTVWPTMMPCLWLDLKTRCSNLLLERRLPSQLTKAELPPKEAIKPPNKTVKPPNEVTKPPSDTSSYVMTTLFPSHPGNTSRTSPPSWETIFPLENFLMISCWIF